MEHLLDAPVAQRLLAAGARHHPATDRRIFVALRKVPQQISVLLQLRLHHRPRRTGLEGRKPVALVDVQQAIELLQAEIDHRPVAGGDVEMSDDAGTATPGDHGRPSLHSRSKCGLGFFGASRQRHRVGHRADPAVAQGEPVRVALSTRVVEARRGVGDEAGLLEARGRDGRQHRPHPQQRTARRRSPPV